MTKLKNTSLAKSLTGIEGLDEITHGGLPTGRTTLISGSAGAGKTVIAMEFLIHGALDYDEPGVFMAFEESERDLVANFASFGFDLEGLEKEGKLSIDHVHVDRNEISENGGFDLEGLFIRLGNAVDTIHAKRVVLDTIEVLFSAVKSEAIVRSELVRLFCWLKDRGLTAIVTGERGGSHLTRFGLEEYAADCVIVLDHRLEGQISTRRLRILKYRGTLHEMDEHPFLMGERGVSVLPLSSVGLNHGASSERVSSGIADLDAMLEGKGFFKGSSVLISGTAGTGKTSLAFAFLQAACERGERAIYFGFEESKSQTIRNLASIGLNLQPEVEKGLLHFSTVRPSSLGLEAHLAAMHQLIKRVKPVVVVMDPISVFMSISEKDPVKSMLTRLVDFLKMEEITTLFTHLSNSGQNLEATEQRISSIMDTWILMRDVEFGDRRRVMLRILKSRGMAHSREMVEFMMSGEGIHLGKSHPKEGKHSGHTATTRVEAVSHEVAHGENSR